MMSIDQKVIREILNLQGSPLISRTIADRQIEVIRRGFNYLAQEDNNVLYIADEVGLGKTYIAIGIASLLRHFSAEPGSYQDMIIVPKENLQNKWEKEIRQFINHNYLLQDNRVKSVIGEPVGEIIRKDHLLPIHTDHPAYHLYRNSQFSLGFNWRAESKKQQLDVMLNRLTDPEAKALFESAINDRYFVGGNKSLLKKFYAYLLSICHPEIELLVVDEGHNYKYGLGSGDDADDEVSDRNNVVTRFLGIKRRTKDDKIIFETFPDLKKRVQPKVKKLVILSATPKTASLAEIRNQLDCFLPQHLLSGLKREEEIKEKLPYFLMRGNMEYSIAGEIYTRNLCRKEHRAGNVEKKEQPAHLAITDDEQAIVLGLLQYNTIKHLEAKNNASFELGMLAGFETFQVDQVKIAKSGEATEGTNGNAEYEEFRSKKIRRSQDYDVLKGILDSYKSQFGCLPPHPKQDAIVNAAFQLMRKGEKSLIFVRRVASAYELERRLLDKWEDLVYEELNSKWLKKFPASAIRQLVNSYKDYKENRLLTENLEGIFNSLTARLISNRNYNFDFLENGKVTESVITTGLFFLYNNHSGVDDIEEWFSLLQRHANLSIIKSEFVDVSFRLLESYYEVWKNEIFDDVSADTDEEPDSYYFHHYFTQQSNQVFKKSRVHSTDWFDVNYFRLNYHFKIAAYREDILNKDEVNKQIRGGNEMKEVQEYFLKHVEEGDYREGPGNFENFHPQLNKPTLITELIIRLCEIEMHGFLARLGAKQKRNVFEDMSQLATIITSILRNGAGFLPLYLADKSEGDFIENYLAIITDEDSVFNLVLKEVKTIINDYSLVRAVNFPESDTVIQIQSKLKSQTPVLGLTGQSKRNKSIVASQFRMPGFPYVMITTDIFREGEDLHTYCQNIYHYGIAWNCSDMEQRTGRIDRINSMSHRKMELSGTVHFDERVHVFYPYVKQTLEVNQVSKLFHSINSFVETFNDFTEAVVDDGIAETGSVIAEMPEVIEKPLQSKYEHHYFRGFDSKTSAKPLHTIGTGGEELVNFLRNVESVINKLPFHYGPVLDKTAFEITGDARLEERRNRRGPFRIKIRNSIYPGKFCVEAASHIFKAYTRIEKAVENHSKFYDQFEFTSIGEYYALAFTTSMESFEGDVFLRRFQELLMASDSIEETLMKGEDAKIFE